MDARRRAGWALTKKSGGKPWRADREGLDPVGLLLRHRGIARIERIDPLTPHLHEGRGSDLVDRFPDVLDGRQRIAPDRLLAPALALLLAFAGGAHRFPRRPFRMLHMLRSALPALLVDQIKIARGRILV